MSSARYVLLDELRGFSLCSMIVYHICWNLDHLFEYPLAWFHTTAAYLWQQSICTVFLLLAGISMHLTRRPMRHLLWVGGSAALITLTTWIFEPRGLIVFGILHCIALCIVLFLLFRPLLDRIPTGFGLVCCVLLFFFTRTIPNHTVGFGPFQMPLPETWYLSDWLSIFGLLSPDFMSADYFPIFPNLFLFLAGVFLGRLLSRLPEWTRRTHCRPLAFMGRHSLLLYLLHQPVSYGAMALLFAN